VAAVLGLQLMLVWIPYRSRGHALHATAPPRRQTWSKQTGPGHQVGGKRGLEPPEAANQDVQRSRQTSRWVSQHSLKVSSWFGARAQGRIFRPQGSAPRQYALRLRITSKTVLTKIWKSSSRLQLFIYQRSSLTRIAISATEGVAPREPLHCAHPVRPGFT